MSFEAYLAYRPTCRLHILPIPTAETKSAPRYSELAKESATWKRFPGNNNYSWPLGGPPRPWGQCLKPYVTSVLASPHVTLWTGRCTMSSPKDFSSKPRCLSLATPSETTFRMGLPGKSGAWKVRSPLFGHLVLPTLPCPHSVHLPASFRACWPLTW